MGVRRRRAYDYEQIGPVCERVLAKAGYGAEPASQLVAGFGSAIRFRHKDHQHLCPVLEKLPQDLEGWVPWSCDLERGHAGPHHHRAMEYHRADALDPHRAVPESPARQDARRADACSPPVTRLLSGTVTPTTSTVRVEGRLPTEGGRVVQGRRETGYGDGASGTGLQASSGEEGFRLLLGEHGWGGGRCGARVAAVRQEEGLGRILRCQCGHEQLPQYWRSVRAARDLVANEDVRVLGQQVAENRRELRMSGNGTADTRIWVAGQFRSRG
ncbi:hypothetical protein GCM10017562_75330 [Streptomyces roseofulvus]